MTFLGRETSVAAGAPVRLYEFQRGIFRWRYTNADRRITWQTLDFDPVAISDDGIRETGEATADALTITVPHDLPVAKLFRGAPPADDISLLIRDMHYGDSEALVSYIGDVEGVRWPTPQQARITCQSLAASMRRAGLRLTYERACAHALYDRNCRVNRDLFAIAATVQSMDGATISSGTFDAQPDGWFDGGYVEWSIGSGETDRRGIERHVGAALTLLGGTYGLSAGQNVIAYPGCLRTAAVCNAKFTNLVNYGGFPHLPGKSPFDGDPVF